MNTALGSFTLKRLAELSKVSFSIYFNVCSAKHINALSNVSTLKGVLNPNFRPSSFELRKNSNF